LNVMEEDVNQPILNGEGLDTIKLQKIKNITGQLSVMAASVCLIYSVLFYYIHIPFLGNLGICIMILAISSRVAWGKGFINYARFSLVVLGNILIFTLSGSLGRDGGTNLLYIPLFCAILVLYNINELGFFIICNVLSLSGLIILELYNYTIFNIPAPTENFMQITHIVSAIVAVGVSITCIYSMQNAGEKAEKTLEEAREEIRKNSLVIQMKNKELEQFAYIASHDLQEPLRTVSSLVDYVYSEYYDKLDDNAKMSFDFMKQANSRMSDLINGLLEYSRLGVNPEATMVDLNELVKSVLSDMSSTINESRAQIRIGSLPVLTINSTEIGLLFQNLISNAIKFRKADHAPEIDISAEKNGNEWTFCIKDDGIGIDPQNQGKIFEMFQRLNKRSEYSGSGIGLAHCKKIIDLHEGKIWVDSQPGIGSSFYFTLKSIINV